MIYRGILVFFTTDNTVITVLFFVTDNTVHKLVDERSPVTRIGFYCFRRSRVPQLIDHLFFMFIYII